MNIIYGVNSVISANQKLKNGYTMFDWVMRQRCFPEFWGRTLIGENPITKDEIRFLRDRDCKIALMINDLNEKIVSSSSGYDDAIRAIEAASKLDIPQNEGIALFAVINPNWSVNHNWMIDFARTIVEYGYVPGFIGNTDSSKNFNFDRQCSHYVQATYDVNQFYAIYGATEPKSEFEPECWMPYCPSALQPEDMDLWFTGSLAFDSLTVEDVYAKNDKILKSMW